MKKTTDALKILDEKFFRTPRSRRMLEEERINLEAALLLRQAREEAGITQAQLAKRIGTTQSVISRLEDSDYRGHTLKYLHRILDVLGQRLRISVEPASERPRPGFWSASWVSTEVPAAEVREESADFTPEIPGNMRAADWRSGGGSDLSLVKEWTMPYGVRNG